MSIKLTAADPAAFLREQTDEIDDSARSVAERIVRTRLQAAIRGAIGELAHSMQTILEAEGRSEYDDFYVEGALQAFIEEMEKIADDAIWPALGIEPP